MRRFLSVLLVSLVFSLSFSGCSTAPEQQIRACEKAIQNAQAAGAEFFAYEIYQEASDSLDSASTEIKHQNSKFMLFRNFGRARHLITSAQKLADNAQTATDAKVKSLSEAEKEVASVYDIIPVGTDRSAGLPRLIMSAESVHVDFPVRMDNLISVADKENLLEWHNDQEFTEDLNIYINHAALMKRKPIDLKGKTRGLSLALRLLTVYPGPRGPHYYEGDGMLRVIEGVSVEASAPFRGPSEVIVFQGFRGWNNIYCAESVIGVPKCAVAVDDSGRVLAAAKFLGMGEGNDFNVLEVHYTSKDPYYKDPTGPAPGKARFKSISTFDVSTGFKTSESEVVGRKEHELFFLWGMSSL